ncbi:hypothetical protein AB0J28_01920 [Streptosporangium canum]|uniref:hypothetical protein n=1 Tax=Streptosporangium canum TaxID=324952 RepID=UPI003431046B
MGLSFVHDPDDGSGRVTVTARLCLTEDRKRLVPDTDPDARWLFCTPGSQISQADAERYGLFAEPEPEPEPEVDQEQGEAKQARTPANKARKPAANK